MNVNDIFSLVISIIAMVISMASLIYTVKTYLYKEGLHITGYYVLCSSIACEDKYVHKIVLENKKDKSVNIYKIYLQIGHNYFLIIDDFEDKPLILNPFEAFTKNYDPLEYYDKSCTCVKLNKLLDDNKVKKRLVLSTSEGKFKVKENKDTWNPIIKFFKNHMTAIIHPIRIIYKGKSYGSNTKYILEFKQDDKEEIVPIYSEDYQIKKFKNFQLTQQSLKSKDNLEKFLEQEKTNGNLICDEFLVLDAVDLKRKACVESNKDPIELEYINWFTYNIVGRIITIYENYKLRQENKKRRIEI